MFKILAVDDEQPVLDGIQRLVERHFTEMTVCATARSGRVAIEKALAMQPDLVLMDVNLPGISGLDAIREIRQGLPHALFILVTAYERFDIAKEAFDLGVADYLLKPVNKDKLLAVLEKSLVTLRRRQDNRRSGVEQLEMLETAQFLLEAEFFRLVEHRPHLEGADWERRMQAFTRVFGLPETGGALAALQAPGIARLAERLKTSLQFTCKALVAPDGPDRLWLFIPAALQAPASIDNQIHATLEGLGQGSSAPLLVIGGCHELRNLDLSRQAVLAGLRDKHPDPPPAGCDWEAEKKLLEQLFYRQEGEFLACLELYCRSLAHSHHDERLRILYHETAIVILHELGHRNPRMASSLELPALDPHADEAAWRDSMTRWAGHLATVWNDRRVHEHPPVVDKTLGFIGANYRRPISLEDAAGAAGVSSQYLSRIFSEHMHESFVDYLTRIRINHARELLRQGASIKTVTHELGYTDPNYFSRLFKKITGLTPSEFARA